MSSDFREGTPFWFAASTRLLGWKPDDFWQATPAELNMALRDPCETPGDAGLSRTRLAEMMERENDG
ncbi:MAG: phage tail assembly chaperone [Pseudomonadota bacterium]